MVYIMDNDLMNLMNFYYSNCKFPLLNSLLSVHSLAGKKEREINNMTAPFFLLHFCRHFYFSRGKMKKSPQLKTLALILSACSQLADGKGREEANRTSKCEHIRIRKGNIFSCMLNLFLTFQSWVCFKLLHFRWVKANTMKMVTRAELFRMRDALEVALKMELVTHLKNAIPGASQAYYAVEYWYKNHFCARDFDSYKHLILITVVTKNKAK